MRLLRASLTPVAFVLAGVSTALPARALVWPDVGDRVERGLSATDPAARRAAVLELRNLSPARGGPLVLRALVDADLEVRVAAAQAALRLRIAAATDVVLEWLGDRETRLRLTACDVARALPNSRAVAPLARALGDSDSSVRAAAAEALGAQQSTEAVPALLGKLDDSSPAVRIQVARALARLGDSRAIVPLVGKVQDSVPEVRQSVARALGELGDLRASQALILQLRDSALEVRVEAAAALGRLRAADAVDALSPLTLDRAPTLRQAAVAALGRIGTSRAVHALVLALGSGDDTGAELERSPVRDALVAAGPAAIPELRGVLLGSPPRAAAVGAAWALGGLGAKSEASCLVAAMRRGILPAAAALRALTGAGTEETIPTVLEFASDASFVVRVEARRAAAALLDPQKPDGRAVDPLAASLGDPRLSTEERATIATLLGRTGAPRSAAIIAPLVGAKERPLRLAAIDALGTLGPADADDTLLQALEDSDPAIRLRAAIALGDSGGARSLDALLGRLGSGDELDRTSLLTALGGVLGRHASDRANAFLARELETAAGPDRDALLEALGRSRAPSAMGALSHIATSGDGDDRRSVATLLAARPGSSDARSLATVLLRDTDASVRAQAAWSLGALGDATSAALLANAASSPDTDVAVNATGAIARIAARSHASGLASRALCPLLADARPYVRANALTGLSLAAARCGDGSRERQILEEDPSDVARAGAALALARSPGSADDKSALERAAATDRSQIVADRCRAPRPTPTRVHPVAIYVIPANASTPKPHASYALELADGLVRAGTADRRGVAFEPAAPEGELALKRPAALAR